MSVRYLKVSLIISFLMIITMVISCEKTYVDDRPDLKEEPEDYIVDTTEAVHIKFNGTSVSIVPPVADAAGGNVTIREAGIYMISGSASEGQIAIDAGDEAIVKIILNGIDLHNSTGAAFVAANAGKTIIFLNEGTENFLCDGSSYQNSDDDVNSALFSNSYLSISGRGSLEVSGNYLDGISTDDGLIINSGNFTVNAKDDGIRGKDYLIIRDGNIKVQSGGDALKSDNGDNDSPGMLQIDKGIFNLNASSGDGITSTGEIKISDGTFNIITATGAVISTGTGSMQPGGRPGGSSGGYSGLISEKAIKAGTKLEISKGIFKINSADDAIHSDGEIVIKNGEFTIASGDDAIHADLSVTIEDGNLTISKCYEGIESASITVNGGSLVLVSVDDAFNATRGQATEQNDGSSLLINGGYIAVNASTGDGLDSNGNVVLKGGTVIIHGPSSQPEVGYDVNGSFSIDGGTLVSTGPNSGNMIETPASSSTQYILGIFGSVSVSTLIHIRDESGNELLTFKPVRNIYYLVFSSPDLKNGSSYQIYTGGSSTGTSSDGFYTGGTYSGGTLRKTVTISKKITGVTL
jgi:hypothetical protein